jgi:hypothetical protein
MPSGLRNTPKLLKGALVDSNILAVPPLIVSFQYNPETITRRRYATLRDPAARMANPTNTPPTEAMGEAQTTIVPPEAISLDIRLDATDALEQGDAVAGRLGVLPALSALEMMITPRSSSLFGGVLGLAADFGFGNRQDTPVLIFVFGRQRVLPVRLTDMNIQEAEYNPSLNPIRVTISVSLQVLEGANPFYRFTQMQREILATLNLGNVLDASRSILHL